MTASRVSLQIFETCKLFEGNMYAACTVDNSSFQADRFVHELGAICNIECDREMRICGRKLGRK